VSEADVAADGTIAAARLVDGRWTVEWPLGTPVFATHGWVGQPRLSPDGTLLAFLDHPLPEDDGGAVAVLDRAGHLRRLTTRYLSVQGLAWTPAGDRLAFTAAITGAARGLRTVSVLGIDDRARHEAPATLRVLDVGAAGRALVARDDHPVRMVAVEPDGRQRDLSWLDGSAVQSWSRDDRQLSFAESWDGAGPEYGIYLRPYDGGAAVRIAEGAIGELSPTADELLVPRTAADGRRALWRVPTGAGQARKVPLPGPEAPATAARRRSRTRRRRARGRGSRAGSRGSAGRSRGQRRWLRRPGRRRRGTRRSAARARDRSRRGAGPPRGELRGPPQRATASSKMQPPACRQMRTNGLTSTTRKWASANTGETFCRTVVAPRGRVAISRGRPSGRPSSPIASSVTS
jgi:hypothetical protein